MSKIKINKLEIENVKRVKAVKFEPTANGITVIGGDNGQGKTTLAKMIIGETISDKETLNEIAYIHNTIGYILDPHSAVGHLALQKVLLPSQYGTVLSTASPKKFNEVIRQVIPSFPTPKVDLSSCHKKCITNSYEAYKEILLN